MQPSTSYEAHNFNILANYNAENLRRAAALYLAACIIEEAKYEVE